MAHLSILEAYSRIPKLRITKYGAGAGAVLAVHSGHVFVGLICAIVCYWLNRLQAWYTRYFWNQTMTLHSSSLKGEPEVRRHLSGADKRKYDKAVRKRFGGEL
jgi:hypothetical protein